jgi:hypothetical protein
MSFKVNDQVIILPFAYNITDTRVGMKAVVTRIDDRSTLLPVRVEYPDGNYNWTNYESLFLIKAAPNQNEAAGKDILDRMQELKASIIARDAAVLLVEQQTEALDALLASYGLKRSDAIVEPLVPTTLKDDFESKAVQLGFKYTLTKTGVSSYLTVGEVYTVEELDLLDAGSPIKIGDDDGDGMWLSRFNLVNFTRVI